MDSSSCMKMLLIIVSLAIHFLDSNGESYDDYISAREKLFRVENASRTGSHVKLNAQEVKVNNHLMQLKEREIKAGLNGENFPPSLHFFHAKKYIDKSEIFRILKSMPKGAALHLHDTSMGDMDWVIQQTYLPHLYMCTSKTRPLKFRFSVKMPMSTDCEWRLVSDVRNSYKNPEIFDKLLYNNLTLVVEDPVTEYPNIKAVWTKFTSLFSIAGGLLFYSDVFEEYYTRALQVFYDDNVQYLEFRAMLPKLYDMEGSTFSQDHVMAVYHNATVAFKKSHPDFTGAKIIYSSIRFASEPDVRDALRRCINYSSNYPDFFAGYDLVGYEEEGHTLFSYLDDLLLPSQMGYKINYFFHAGETDWSGMYVDDNLIDAILLNTSRIGHGYAINKHPQAKKLALQKDIPIEICPLSNQVLKLVDDLRNHPGASLLTEGYPVVISADDPALWGARGLSYDWYQAFMGLGSGWADLRTLKQLAMDSLKYSSLTAAEKKDALQLWQKKWDHFVDQYIHTYHL